MFYLKLVAAGAILAALGYWRRYGIRQAWLVLRTGDKDPDFEKINSEYFLGRKASHAAGQSLQSEIKPTL
jgi:hypothetical protein